MLTKTELKIEHRGGYILTMTKINLGFGMEFINGYVSVPDDSTLFMRDYWNDIERKVNIHGGVTYADMMHDKWTFGFDTAHVGDNNPSIQNEEYVWGEVESLYEQLKGLENAD